MGSASEAMTHAQRAAIGATAGDQARAGQSIIPADSDASDRRPVITTERDMHVLLAWAAGYDGQERGKLEAQAWLAVLQGYAIDDVKNAISAYFGQARKFYRIFPGDVIELIEDGAP